MAAFRRWRRVDARVSDHEVDSDTHVIELAGEFDLYTAPEFKARLAEVIAEGKCRVVVDLSEVTFLDSTMLGVLVGGVKRLGPGGGSLELIGARKENVMKMFETTGLDRVFRIHGAREEALAEGAEANGV